MRICFNMVTLLLVASFASYVLCHKEPHPLSDDFIKSINKEQSLWKAGRNFDINTPMSALRGLMGLAPGNQSDPVPAKTFHPAKFLEIPENFDAREQWPECKSIGHITDQSACESCWAVAAASAMTDRICIKSKGKNQATVSSADIIGCCRGDSCGHGCNKGRISGPWKYWVHTGISIGGDYGSSEGCINYPFAPCNHLLAQSSKPSCIGKRYETPECKQTCDFFNKKITKPLTYGKNYYSLNSVEEMQVEIMENGPIEAGLAIYSDFFNYKTGIYKKAKGLLAGYHAVKILGWGVQEGIPYWLIANSWNEEWGDNGFFKIVRGINECSIEDLEVYAGEPLL